MAEHTPDDQYDFGETLVEASVHSAASATPEQLADMADEIWHKVQDSGVAEDDQPGNDALLRRLQEEYRNFTHSFPIVVRLMVQMRDYRRSALLRFLKKHASRKLSSRRDFLMLQADFCAELSRAKGRPEHVTRRYRAAVLESLEEEDRSFEEMKKKADAEIASRDSEIADGRRKELLRLALVRRLAEKDAGAPGAPEAGRPPADA